MEVTSSPAERSFFRALSLLKLYTGLQYHIYFEFRQTSKNFQGGIPKHVLEKKRVSKYGRLTVPCYCGRQCFRCSRHCKTFCWNPSQNYVFLFIDLFVPNFEMDAGKIFRRVQCTCRKQLFEGYTRISLDDLMIYKASFGPLKRAAIKQLQTASKNVP